MPIKTKLVYIWEFIRDYNRNSLDSTLTKDVINNLFNNLKKYHETYCSDYLQKNGIVRDCSAPSQLTNKNPYIAPG
jgi:hypothetical protein